MNYSFNRSKQIKISYIASSLSYLENIRPSGSQGHLAAVFTLVAAVFLYQAASGIITFFAYCNAYIAAYYVDSN